MMRRRIILGVTGVASALGSGIASGEPVAHESPLGLLSSSRATDWQVRTDAFVRPLRGSAYRSINSVNAFHFNRVIVVFPLLSGASNARLDDHDYQARLFKDDFVVDEKPEILDGYFLGARMLLFDAQDVDTFTMRVSLETRVTAWALAFDEEAARQIDWPANDWPLIARSALEPQLWIDPQDEAIQRLMREWVGPDARDMGPMALAKSLAANVIDSFQINGNGYEFNSRGRIGGLQIRGAGIAAKAMRGSPFDQAALLCAVYRAVGIPSRVVIGYDIGASIEGLEIDELSDRESCQPVEADTIPAFPILRPWVEFFLYDEASGLGEWIPVDINLQRSISSQSRPLDQEWEFFGNMPCGDLLIPISFHFHPPEAVASPGPPGLWGWLAFPETPRLEQQFHISAMTAPKTAADMP